MASTATITSINASSNLSANTASQHPPLSRVRRIAGLTTASSPNLNQLYSSQGSSLISRLAPPGLGLSRKASLAALTPNSLASIPDDTEAYALNTVLTTPTAIAENNKMPSPLTPGRLTAAAAASGGDDLRVGDTVDVPGGMHGSVRFVGSVPGRKGVFAGVELHAEFADRGKNSGDVDGVHYFTTTQPGAGIFLPLSKAVKRDSPPTSASSFPLTPTGISTPGGLKLASQNSTNFTPPTPSLPKFSQSVGPNRAPSPTGKKLPRTSLPRPDSPVRRIQMTPGPRPSIATPGPKGPARYGSPTTTSKFAQSVRGTAGDPSKRTGANRERKGSISGLPRSASALGNSRPTTSSGHGYNNSTTDDETTPVGIQRTRTNGSVGSVSSFSQKIRPGSRTANHAGGEEMERLRTQLEDRDRQLKDQASTLAEMESSLTELQGLIESSDGPPSLGMRGGAADKDVGQLRALLREKNEKIAMLTAEFDAHRADFRSTIDTLEMASTETERVYEKRIEELMAELQDLQERTADVDAVAGQLKQFEEMVQELEEGLEDARRGEAEARGEVEFLRGEVERTRSELRREREKAQAAMNGGGVQLNGDGKGASTNISKELEQKEDEIRGLKAIIHSLSRDSVPGDDRPTPTRRGSSVEERLGREKLERELNELRVLIDSKNRREEELEREVETLRRGSTGSHGGNQRSSIRDSRGTVVLAPRSPESNHMRRSAGLGLGHSRGPTLDTMPESDAYSTATENSTLWCEICETAGHDILTCTNMFGSEAGNPGVTYNPNKNNGGNNAQSRAEQGGVAAAAAPPRTPPPAPAKLSKQQAVAGLKNLTVPGLLDDDEGNIKPAPLSPVKVKTPTTVPPEVKILPNPMDSGPVAGKESGVVDADKWCALCERDGHDSVDCPFEDAF